MKASTKQQNKEISWKRMKASIKQHKIEKLIELKT
jgi:hypothetical protein